MSSQLQRLCCAVALSTAALAATTLAAPELSHAQTPPPAPMDVQAAGGGGWQPDPTFNVSWHNPSATSPIVAAHYQLCGPAPAPGPTECQTHAADDLEETVVTVPRPGIFTMQVWLEDDEGNGSGEGPHLVSSPILLHFDDGTPGPPRVRNDGAWLNAEQADGYTLTVEMDRFAPGHIPISWIRAYRVSLDGSVPDDESPEIPAALDYVGFPGTDQIDPEEGVTEVRMTAISYAGVLSTELSSGLIKIDRSPPTVAAHSAPAPGVWQRSGAKLTLIASDQPGLSGMTPAPSHLPVQEGGHIGYRHNGGALQRVRGDRAALTLSDGHHSLTYQAFDAAGNPSTGRETTLAIDRTPPSVAFAARRSDDPRALIANVGDATSGVAEGRIEIRSARGGKWQALPTSLQAGRRLLAQIDDRLPKGRYELRAHARDVAGNWASSNLRENGTPMAVALPIRQATSIATAAMRPRCRAKPRKRRKPKARRASATDAETAQRRRRAAKCPRRRALRKSSSIRTGHGKPTATTGRLRTATGAPVGGAAVVVESRLRAGAEWVRHALRRTGRDGTFRYRISAGPSRQVRYRYDGSNTLQPSTSVIATHVRAALTLRPSARKLVNGEQVMFRGRLRGKPIPKAGKAVLLQAQVGKRWRTFATPRADRRGRFRQSYRFTSTTGLRSYRFRAVSVREAAYPYARGRSRTVTVVVRGR